VEKPLKKREEKQNKNNALEEKNYLVYLTAVLAHQSCKHLHSQMLTHAGKHPYKFYIYICNKRKYNLSMHNFTVNGSHSSGYIK